MSGSGSKRKREKKAKFDEYSRGDFVVFEHGYNPPQIYVITGESDEGYYPTRGLIQDKKNPGVYICDDNPEMIKFEDYARRVRNIIEFPETISETWSKKKWYDKTAEDGSLGLLQLFFSNRCNDCKFDLKKSVKHYAPAVKQEEKKKSPKKKSKNVSEKPPAYDSAMNEEKKEEKKEDIKPEIFETTLVTHLTETLQQEKIDPKQILGRMQYPHTDMFDRLNNIFNDANVETFGTNNPVDSSHFYGKATYDLILLDYGENQWEESDVSRSPEDQPRKVIESLFKEKKFQSQSILAVCLSQGLWLSSRVHIHVSKCADDHGYKVTNLYSMPYDNDKRMFAVFRVGTKSVPASVPPAFVPRNSMLTNVLSSAPAIHWQFWKRHPRSTELF